MKKGIGLICVVLMLLVVGRLNPIELISARLVKGRRIYVPIYSSIYIADEHKLMNLTSTLSIRNTSVNSEILISQVDYYDSNGMRLKEFMQKPVSLRPLATVDIVVPELDSDGGTGGQFFSSLGFKGKNCRSCNAW